MTRPKALTLWAPPHSQAGNEDRSYIAFKNNALSHETAHRTAFKTKWLNEAVFYLTSWLYEEEPLHRRYIHINPHEGTWHAGLDSQMPFDTPMSFWDWFREASSLGFWRFHGEVALRLLRRRPTPMMRDVIPVQHFPAMQRTQAIFLVGYILVFMPLLFGQYWTLWFFILPRIIGAPIMLQFTILQHAELQENASDICKSTRSFQGSWWVSFLYMNMENHVEHHLYSSIPFHALPKLSKELADQVPAKDPGFWRSSWDVISIVWRRSRGLPTKAAFIRQAPHMVTEGGPIQKLAHRSM